MDHDMYCGLCGGAYGDFIWDTYENVKVKIDGLTKINYYRLVSLNQVMKLGPYCNTHVAEKSARTGEDPWVIFSDWMVRIWI